MRLKHLRNGALAIVSALLAAACTTSKPAPVTADGLRQVVGTSFIGAQGRTPEDQERIDETSGGFAEPRSGRHRNAPSTDARADRKIEN